ncbi:MULTISPECIES: hypothetical protein [Pectobacterium]|uniref:hypothetical protein n=1 Tax=Pectobacterium TaxID=122277 RepID=UPI002B242FA7|nr:hypothetical protein [Pectobacterium versatile]
MINGIHSEPLLSVLHRDTIEENGVNIIIDEEFYDKNGKLKSDIIANLSVDSYYNSLGLGATPPSPDNLVVIKRGEKKYCIYIVELKNVTRTSTLKAHNIKKKFDTAINDFMNERFSDIFNKSDTKITDITLWLVCNRFEFIDSEISEEDYLKRIRGSVIESLLLAKPWVFRNKIAKLDLMLSGKEII